MDVSRCDREIMKKKKRELWKLEGLNTTGCRW